MQGNLEVLEGLARRLDISVPVDQLETEVQSRLKRLARSVKMHGFRPGKAPLSAVARQHGAGVRQEVLGETLKTRFGEAVQTHQLRIAGYPRFEPKADASAAAEMTFSASFEVYPEVKIDALDSATLNRPVVELGDADVAKTLEVLQKQRRTFATAARAAAEGDLVKFDYQGTVDGAPFEGGRGEDFAAVIGEGRLLKDFEQALVGLKAGDSKGFDLTFPAEYAARELADKTAHFEVQVKEVQAPVLPPVDAEFAEALGVEDGDVEKLKAEVKSNLEREVKRRVQAKLKEQAMELLLQKSTLDLPRSLVEMEMDRLRRMTEADMQSRGVQSMKLSADMFTGQAERRVRLGLILAEIVQANKLAAQPEQIRSLIQDQAQSYEEPDQVVQWYYQSPERMQEIESLALEENVVAWVADQATVVDVATSFDELMGRA
ncbi:trigger factor [Thiobacillus denitrificans ATCC 25259]|uniref:Trigger factor n=1 Tax=Thiobacillus denitrificans (strain ATCC 25259 / T1) TaxID=292415 RepID=TIG_THIDA|nr:trigger factor [Thiobacillus denitrificans]Q3SI97.1 RecName: Full=Trigger factor; Short=TF; AltName: Full=PPIase [Thiobacillus denitrificans ATCC 25259]AAZ97631.1 trigger factor [Thiobacillus denitrificans ATCC 25259]